MTNLQAITTSYVASLLLNTRVDGGRGEMLNDVVGGGKPCEDPCPLIRHPNRFIWLFERKAFGVRFSAEFSRENLTQQIRTPAAPLSYSTL